MAKDLGWEACGEHELLKAIGSEYQRGRKLLLILDQFERYLSRAADPELVLGAIVRDSGLPVHICASIREDELYRLDRLRDLGFNPFQNLFALPDLEVGEAEEAILNPLDEHTQADVRNRLPQVIRGLLEHDEKSKRVFATILGIVCYEGWQIAQKESRRLFSKPEDTGQAIGNYVSKELGNLCPEENSYRSMVFATLRALLEGGQRVQLTRDQVQERARVRDTELTAEAAESVLTDLLNHRLLDHDPTAGYRVVHELFIVPLQEQINGEPAKAAVSNVPTAADQQNQDNPDYSDRLSFAELGLSLAQNGTNKEQARQQAVRLWPAVRRHPASREVMRRIAALLLRQGNAQSRLKSGGIELRGAALRIELWNSELQRRVFQQATEREIVDCSLSSDVKCVVARDAAGMVYLWDSGGRLILKVEGGAEVFAALTLSPEEMYSALGGVAPERWEVAVEPMTITLEDLTELEEVSL
jgi:hypothetical protein